MITDSGFYVTLLVSMMEEGIKVNKCKEYSRIKKKSGKQILPSSLWRECDPVKLLWTSDFWNQKRMDTCCFESSSVQHAVTAAQEAHSESIYFQSLTFRLQIQDAVLSYHNPFRNALM